MANADSYWQRRAEQRLDEAQAGSDAALQMIGDVHAAARERILTEIDRIQSNYKSSFLCVP